MSGYQDHIFLQVQHGENISNYHVRFTGYLQHIRGQMLSIGGQMLDIRGQILDMVALLVCSYCQYWRIISRHDRGHSTGYKTQAPPRSEIAQRRYIYFIIDLSTSQQVRPEVYLRLLVLIRPQM